MDLSNRSLCLQSCPTQSWFNGLEQEQDAFTASRFKGSNTTEGKDIYEFTQAKQSSLITCWGMK